MYSQDEKLGTILKTFLYNLNFNIKIADLSPKNVCLFEWISDHNSGGRRGGGIPFTDLTIMFEQREYS